MWRSVLPYKATVAKGKCHPFMYGSKRANFLLHTHASNHNKC